MQDHAIYHILCQVYATDTSCPADQPGCNKEVEAGAAADIQYRRSRRYLPQRERIADTTKRFDEARWSLPNSFTIILQRLCTGPAGRISKFTASRDGNFCIFLFDGAPDCFRIREKRSRVAGNWSRRMQLACALFPACLRTPSGASGWRSGRGCGRSSYPVVHLSVPAGNMHYFIIAPEHIPGKSEMLKIRNRL